jgi:hypothetical protein
LFKDIKIKQRTNLISFIIFIATLVVVFLNALSVVFPALLVRLTSNFEDKTINIFQLGEWAIPLLSANLIIFGIALLYHKRRLPSLILKPIKFIFNFEISKKTAVVVFLFLLIILIGINLGNLSKEETWGDYSGRKYDIEHYSTGPISSLTINIQTFLLYVSFFLLKNPRIIPFIASICLFITVYLFTVQISNKRFAGIVSLVILLQSRLFFTYDVSATYPNFWILFYLLSLYLINNKWYLSPISFIYSAFAKGLSEVFLPMTLFFILKSEISRRRKIITIAFYAIIVMTIAYLVLTIPSLERLFVPTRPLDRGFWDGFTSLPYELRYDGIILLFLLPLTVGLFLASRKGTPNADFAMFLIFGQLLSSALLIGLTSLTLEPYRNIALLVFFAIGVGILLSNKTTSKV